MLNLLRAKHSRMLVWTLLVLIVVGLAGFGIGNSGAFHSSKVATVGDESIDGVTYARAMDRELRAVSGQIGRSRAEPRWPVWLDGSGALRATQSLPRGSSPSFAAGSATRTTRAPRSS